MRLKIEKPLQSRVKEAILELIREENLGSGEQLPTESELLKLLGVGRSTLRETLANLTNQGVLYKIQGKGTFVRHVPIVMKNGLEQLFSVTENILSVGAKPSVSRMHIKTFPVEKSLAEKLNINPKDICYWVERVRMADEDIAAYCIDILPASVLKSDVQESDFKGSLFELLSQSGHLISHTESTIHPTTLTPRDLPEMTEEIGLFLFFEEIYFSTHGVPVCYSNDYYSAGIFDFKMIRKRNL